MCVGQREANKQDPPHTARAGEQPDSAAAAAAAGSGLGDHHTQGKACNTLLACAVGSHIAAKPSPRHSMRSVECKNWTHWLM